MLIGVLFLQERLSRIQNISRMIDSSGPKDTLPSGSLLL